MPWGLDFNPSNSFVGSLISGILGALHSLIIFIWNALQAVYHFLITGLIVVAQFLLRMLGHVGRFFRNVWDKWIQRGILKLLELYQRLIVKLERFLEPVLRVIRRIRAILDYWYNRLFGPILNLIQQVRGVLQIFRIFNLKFAKALDERLLRLEVKITQPYLILRAKLNEVITWLTLGTDPSMVISRNVLLGSIGRIFGALARLTHVRFSRPLTPQEESEQDFDRNSIRPDKAFERAAQRDATGWHPEEKKLFSTMRAAMEESTHMQLPKPVLK